jgi:hypothetical protein
MDASDISWSWRYHYGKKVVMWPSSTESFTPLNQVELHLVLLEKEMLIVQYMLCVCGGHYLEGADL